MLAMIVRSMGTADPLLETENVTRKFGSLVAVDGVSLRFREDEFASIVGPNGAGKTTLFDLVTGGLPVTSGRIYVDGHETTNYEPHDLVELGLARSFQVTNIFPEMTVLENIAVTVQQDGEWYNFWRSRTTFEDTRERAREVMALLQLSKFRDETAQSLSHADQRMLEVALALATDPTVLLLDEPTAGMSRVQTDEFMEILSERVFPQVSLVIMVEHDMEVVMEYSDRVIVLHKGSVLVDGTPDEVRTDEEVQRVYLGEE
jgi:branched-chain amino acid transport system ATP-binding protein